jgi:hypothetical protein
MTDQRADPTALAARSSPVSPRSRCEWPSRASLRPSPHRRKPLGAVRLARTTRDLKSRAYARGWPVLSSARQATASKPYTCPAARIMALAEAAVAERAGAVYNVNCAFTVKDF